MGFRVQEERRAAVEVLEALRRVPAARAVLERIARDVPGAMDVAGTVDDAGIRDAWGTALRCLTADSGTDADRQAVAAHGGRPIFISDGPDGEGMDEMRSDVRSNE
jgi:hypothetical protein